MAPCICHQNIVTQAGWVGMQHEAGLAGGGLDDIVLKAGNPDSSLIADLSFADWRRVLSISLYGACLTVQTPRPPDVF